MVAWPTAAGATVRNLSRTDEATFTDAQGRRVTCTVVSTQIFDDQEQYMSVETRIEPAPGCGGYAHVSVNYRDPDGAFRNLVFSGRMVASGYTYPGVGSIDQSIHSASFDGCGCGSEQYLLPK
jgi:hypothetical protein